MADRVVEHVAHRRVDFLPIFRPQLLARASGMDARAVEDFRRVEVAHAASMERNNECPAVPPSSSPSLRNGLT